MPEAARVVREMEPMRAWTDRSKPSACRAAQNSKQELTPRVEAAVNAAVQLGVPVSSSCPPPTPPFAPLPNASLPQLPVI